MISHALISFRYASQACSSIVPYVTLRRIYIFAFPIFLYSNVLEALATQFMPSTTKEDIFEDTAALIAQIRALERTNAQLSSEVARLVDENTRLYHRHHRKWAMLAPEILLCIFHSVMPSRKYSLDPSLVLGRRSLWVEAMRTKKALALVCKSWHGPAIEFLYEDIVIRRMGQIVALARTLRLENCDFARLIKAIHIDNLAILPSCIDVVKEDFETIVSRCTMLKEVSLCTEDHFPYLGQADVDDTVHEFIPTWMITPQIYQQLQRLRFTATLTDRQLPVIHRLLASAVHLVSLTLYNYQVLPPESFSSLEPLSLPSLEDLTISTPADYVTTKWTLPKLRSLTTFVPGAVPIDLLRAHGRLLRYLHLHSPLWFSPQGLKQLSEHCPTLQHLVLVFPQSLPVEHVALLALPNLCYLDMWAWNFGSFDVRPHQYKAEFDRIRSAVEGSGLPTSCTIRVIGGLLNDLRTIDFPRVFPPGAIEPGEWRVHDIPGARVIQTSWALLADWWPYTALKCECGAVDHAKDTKRCLLGEDRVYLYPEDAEDSKIYSEDGCSDDDGSEDGSCDIYLPREGTGKEVEDTTSLISGGSDAGRDDDGNGTDEDDDSDLDLSREDPGYGEQLDRDTILEMFSRSQDAWFEIDGIYDDGIAQENLLTLSTDTWR
ncbi:hypothetical protein C8Q74DRAFT_188884 [Fomes fomentarius]|nr:hypothetical protein C8Q74DRAFT_188884 [Fomes fomentarius]